ncbi:KaiC associated regulatory domain protein [Thermus sp.]
MVLEPKGTDLEATVLRVFLKVIDLVGGPKALAEKKRLTWAGSLMTAAYVVVLAQEALKGEEAIARELGLSSAAVRQILRADPDAALKRVSEMGEGEAIRTHIAGGLAKAAYRLIRQGQEEPRVLRFFLERFVEVMGIPWAVLTLKAVKGLDFPADKAALLERLKGLKIQDIPAEELLERLEYPVQNPADLLHQIRLHLEA